LPVVKGDREVVLRVVVLVVLEGELVLADRVRQLCLVVQLDAAVVVRIERGIGAATRQEDQEEDRRPSHFGSSLS
jgi:hypothetical protein